MQTDVMNACRYRAAHKLVLLTGCLWLSLFQGNMEEFSVCAALEVFSAICKSPLAGPHQAGVMLSDKQVEPSWP